MSPGRRLERGVEAPRGTRAVVAVLFLAGTVAAFLTASGYGIASDVANYFASSLRQLDWARELLLALRDRAPSGVLERSRVLEAWTWNAARIPHPPLSRELYGLSWWALRGMLDPLTAYRVPAFLAFGALAAGCASYTARATGRVLAGAAAGLFVAGVPMLFAHGHLAHTDLLLATFWFGAAACIELWSREGAPGLLLASGALLGAAAATKFTGLLLVAPISVWVVAARPRHALPGLLVLGLVAAGVFVAVNPVLWVAPRVGLDAYLGAGLERSVTPIARIATRYLGETFVYRGPWHYPLVWTVAVLPVSLLAACVLGLAGVRRHPRPVLLCLLHAATLYIALELPRAPMHDGARLFLPVFPFLCVLGGIGVLVLSDLLAVLLHRAREDVAPAWAAVLALVLACGPALGATVRSHPHQLSWFSAAVGGTPGADRLGLEVTGLKEVLNRAVLADLAGRIAPGARVDPGFFLEEACFDRTVGRIPSGWRIASFHPATGEGRPLLLGCARKPDFLPVPLAGPPPEPGYVFVLNRPALWRPLDRALVEKGGAWYEVRFEGVPLMWVFRSR